MCNWIVRRAFGRRETDVETIQNVRIDTFRPLYKKETPSHSDRGAWETVREEFRADEALEP